MTDALIRPAVASDRIWLVRAIAAINVHERKLHDSRRPGEDWAEAYLAQVESAIAEHGGAILVACRHDERLGCIAFHAVRGNNAAETADSNNFGYVSDLFVTEAERGRGLAGRLLHEAERHFRAAGVRRMRIGSLTANAPAVQAYRKFGFGDYEVVLEKRLGP